MKFDIEEFVNNAVKCVTLAEPAPDRPIAAAAYVAACNHLRMLKVANRFQPALVPSSLLLVLSHLETLRAEARDARVLDAPIEELYAALAAEKAAKAKEDSDS